ncbi:MAG: Tad domain-containing protein [Candidatus Riflebacteria bacterium]|nr:Tad domain-containing protein [Candidatus Riflebacteria bacterium]
MKNRKITQNSRRGGILIMAGVASIFLIGMVAMVTDVGWAYFNKLKLQTAVNAAWKAGYDASCISLDANAGAALTTSQKSAVTARVKAVFMQNGYSQTDADALVITFAPTATSSNHLDVASTRPISLFFANFMNFSSMNISADRGTNLIATSTNDDGSGNGDGIVPVGVVHGDLLPYTSGNKQYYSYRAFDKNALEGYTVGQEYILRMAGANDPSPTIVNGCPAGYVQLNGGGNSNQGSLALDGNGAANWQDLFINGYSEIINLNDRLNTEPGGTNGPVDSAKNTRIANNDLRIIVPIVDIPPEVIDPTAVTTFDLNGKTTNRVIGFAVFDMTAPSGDHATFRTDLGKTYPDKEIRGVFVKYIVSPYQVASGTLN